MHVFCAPLAPESITFSFRNRRLRGELQWQMLLADEVFALQNLFLHQYTRHFACKSCSSQDKRRWWLLFARQQILVSFCQTRNPLMHLQMKSICCCRHPCIRHGSILDATEMDIYLLLTTSGMKKPLKQEVRMPLQIWLAFDEYGVT